MSKLTMPSILPAPTEPIMFSNMTGTVLIHVNDGDRKTAFVLHRKLLVNSSTFFATHITNNPDEPSPQEITLPNDQSAVAFEAFSQWLYRQLIAITTITSTEDCIHGYLLGRFLGTPKFAELHRNQLYFRYPHGNIDSQLSMLEHGLATIKSGNPLRKVFIDNFVTELSKKGTNSSSPSISSTQDQISHIQNPPFSGRCWNGGWAGRAVNDERWTKFTAYGDCPFCKRAGVFDVVGDVCVACGDKHTGTSDQADLPKKGLFSQESCWALQSSTGAQNSNPQFGNSLFGNASAAGPGTSLFSRNTKSQPHVSLFPITGLQNSASGSPSPFGMIGNSTSSSLFPNRSTGWQQTSQSTGRFGNSPSTTSKGIFGFANVPANLPEDQLPSNKLFGTGFASVSSSDNLPFVPYRETEVGNPNLKLDYQSINFHPDFTSLSPEEMRLADYASGKGVQPKLPETTPLKHSQLNPLKFGTDAFATQIKNRRENPLFTPPGPSTHTNQPKEGIFGSGGSLFPRISPREDNESQNVKDQQIHAQTASISTVQAQVTMLTEGLMKFTIDNNERMKLLEKCLQRLESQTLRNKTSSENLEEKSSTEEEKSTPKPLGENTTTTVTKQGPKEAETSGYEDNKEEIARTNISSPVLILTPSTSRSPTEDPVVLVCPDEAESTNKNKRNYEFSQ